MSKGQISEDLDKFGDANKSAFVCFKQASLMLKGLKHGVLAKSAKIVFHYNTQKLLGERLCFVNLPKKRFTVTRRCLQKMDK